jgi:hypothetical protein
MIHYYINPETSDLIAFNDESREVTILELVGQVLVTEKQAALLEPETLPSYRQPRKQRLCSVCQKPGHTSKPCPKNRARNYGYDDEDDSDADDEDDLEGDPDDEDDDF